MTAEAETQDQQIDIEVVYALAEKQSLISLEVEKGCTAIEAVTRSGITKLYPDINLDNISLGIFSKACNTEQVLQLGDRVEIYRPLIADPKESRKKRAAKMALKKK